MSSQLATRFCDKKKADRTAQLQAEVAGFRPEDDPEVIAGWTVHDFDRAADAVLQLPHDRVRAELDVLSRAARRVMGRLREAVRT